VEQVEHLDAIGRPVSGEHGQQGGYLGCCYLYPMGNRTKLTKDLLEHDVDVSWWVTPSAYDRGYYTKAHSALTHWLANDLPFHQPHFSNRQIPG
jgi:RimJ/RimL family protein N-acetyltransferase